jgi:ribosomal 50S subunit-recycling heat shock protein
MSNETELQVEMGGARLDRYIAEHLPDFSRAAVQRLIDDAYVRVNGMARKADYRVQSGETIAVCVPPPELARPRAKNFPLDILGSHSQREVRRTYRDPQRTGRRGRPPWGSTPGVGVIQAVKRWRRGRVVGVEVRVVCGEPAKVPQGVTAEQSQ